MLIPRRASSYSPATDSNRGNIMAPQATPSTTITPLVAPSSIIASNTSTLSTAPAGHSPTTTTTTTTTVHHHHSSTTTTTTTTTSIQLKVSLLKQRNQLHHQQQQQQLQLQQQQQQQLALRKGRQAEARLKQRSQIQFVVVAAITYILSPVDLIPEAFFGIFGILDDLLCLFMCLFCIGIIILYPIFREARQSLFDKLGLTQDPQTGCLVSNKSF